MVDFQERDTRRGIGSDDDDEAGGDDGAEGSAEPDSDQHDHGDHDHADHDHHAHDVDHLGVAILTVSSTRSLKDDPAGDAIAAVLENDGDDVVTRELVNDDFDSIQRSVDVLAGRGDVDVVITTGGTGVSPDDVTPDAVRPLFDKELPGVGELFRLLSYEEVGPKTVGSRATGGIVGTVPVFCLPGSESAARLGAERIVLPEAGHLAGLASRS